MKKIFRLLLGTLLLSPGLFAQDRILHYNVLHNGEKKGNLLLYQEVNGQHIHIKIESEVKTRFLLLITVKSIEEAVFEDGVLIFSSICRKVNGSEKINQQLRANGNSYAITGKDSKTGLPPYPIYHSILSLYYREPVNLSSVYSDNFQQYVEIKKVDSNRYVLNLPNGNHNYYTYKNGICTNVEVDQSFYTMQFVLTNKK